MTAQEYHNWLVQKMDYFARRDADLAYQAKEDGDNLKHEFLARSCKEVRNAQMWVESLSPSRALAEKSKPKS